MVRSHAAPDGEVPHWRLIIYSSLEGSHAAPLVRSRAAPDGEEPRCSRWRGTTLLPWERSYAASVTGPWLLSPCRSVGWQPEPKPVLEPEPELEDWWLPEPELEPEPDPMVWNRGWSRWSGGWVSRTELVWSAAGGRLGCSRKLYGKARTGSLEGVYFILV